MKLTKQQLKQIIKEELEVVLSDAEAREFFGDDVLEGETLDEKKNDFLGDVKSTGEWTDYTIEQLKSKIATANKEQENHRKDNKGKSNPEITKRLRQMNFAKNAKEGDYKKDNK